MDVLLIFIKAVGLIFLVLLSSLGMFSLLVLMVMPSKVVNLVLDELEDVQSKEESQLSFFKLDFKDGNGRSQIWIASGETAEDAKNKVLAVAPNLANQVIIDEELDPNVATFVCDQKEFNPMILTPKPGRSTPIINKDSSSSE